MPVIEINYYYAEWRPANIPGGIGRGKIIIRNKKNSGDIHTLENLSSDDFRNLHHLLQTEKPIFWDTDGKFLRTSNIHSSSAEPVGEEES